MIRTTFLAVLLVGLVGAAAAPKFLTSAQDVGTPEVDICATIIADLGLDPAVFGTPGVGTPDPMGTPGVGMMDGTPDAMMDATPDVGVGTPAVGVGTPQPGVIADGTPDVDVAATLQAFAELCITPEAGS